MGSSGEATRMMNLHLPPSGSTITEEAPRIFLRVLLAGAGVSLYAHLYYVFASIEL
jgi:hypothetical protein